MDEAIMVAGNRRAQASAEAADWWLALTSKEITRPEREQYVAWLRESPVHISEMLRMARLHKSLAKLDCWDEVNIDDDGSEDKVIEFSDPPPRSPAPRLFTRWALAASVVAVALFAGYLKYSGTPHVIETQRGERREVALSDGSFIKVDPETRLRVEYDSGFRTIELEQGRALFRVAKDPVRPFTVRARSATVRALGTTFAVDRWRRDIIVTVAEGKVAVSEGNNRFGTVEPGSSSGSSARAQSLVLNTGEQITIVKSGASRSIRKIDSGRELAWTQGRLVFQNASVEDAIAEFNRYNRKRLRVVNAGAAVYPVNGVFDASDAESFVAFLEAVSRVTVVREVDAGR